MSDTKIETIIHQPASALSPDEVVRSLFGMPVDALVRDMHINPGGKYNAYLSKEKDVSADNTP